MPTRADHLNASTYLEKGWSLMSLGDHAGAEAALVRALELSPNDPHGESLLGWAQMLQDKHDDALLNFQKVLMRQPQNSLARINVGYICLKKKIFGEAIEHLSKAIRLDNDRKATLYAHYYLGLLYLEREMYEDAQNFLRKAIALGPNLIEAHYELGRAIFFAGDREGAMGAWRDGARANKFSPWGKRCAEVLQQVERRGTSHLTRRSRSDRAGASRARVHLLRPSAPIVATRTGDRRVARVTRGGERQIRATRIERGRFLGGRLTAETRRLLARSSTQRLSHDTFPGLPRPTERVLIQIAPGPARLPRIGRRRRGGVGRGVRHPRRASHHHAGKRRLFVRRRSAAGGSS